MTSDPTLVELASRAVGGAVIVANDDLFAERENLITAGPPAHLASTFGHRGQLYDGWETRRRRETGRDWAVVRLGMPGVIRRVVVDTSFFTGNYPPEISVDGCGVEGYPAPTELEEATWAPIVARSPIAGNTINDFSVDATHRFTHVRLCLYPDGGVARLRVYGEPVADPRVVPGGRMDLAAVANGATVTDCSNRFYSSPSNLISPGPALVMGDGWETARRRDGGNDWVEIRLAGAGMARLAELDTTHFVGNAPGWASLRGRGDQSDLAPGTWPVELLPRTRLQPDTRHLFRIDPGQEVSAIRLDVYPDGGMARLRLHGRLAAAARDRLARRWWDLLPDAQVTAILTGLPGVGLPRMGRDGAGVGPAGVGPVGAGRAEPGRGGAGLGDPPERPLASLDDLPARLVADLFAD